MIVCSCNVLTSEKIKECLDERKDLTVPSVGTIIKDAGCNAVCGSCATTIREQIIKHYEVKNENP